MYIHCDYLCISLRKSFRKSQNSQSTQHSRPQLVLIRLLNSMKYAFIKILSFSPRSHTHINDLHFAAFRRTCMHTEINFMLLHSAACTCIQKQTSCHRFRCTHIHTKRKFISSYSHISHRFHLLFFFSIFLHMCQFR